LSHIKQLLDQTERNFTGVRLPLISYQHSRRSRGRNT
jgi:hypothetical protein